MFEGGYDRFSPFAELDRLFEDISRGLKNEASVFGQVLADVPSAVWKEIGEDWNKNCGKLLTKEGLSLGLGAATGIALARSPFLAKGVLGALFAYQGYDVGTKLFSLAGRAWDTDSPIDRQILSQHATKGISRALADVAETTPAFMLGGGAGMYAGRRFSATNNFALSVRDRLNDPAQYSVGKLNAAIEEGAANLIPAATRERWAFGGPGSERLPAKLMTENGKLDLLDLSRLMAERHPWIERETLVRLDDGKIGRMMLGTEQWRSIRLADMKASRTYIGSDLELKVPFADRSGNVTFHTHPPEGMSATYPVAGARPSIFDLRNTSDVGIIQSGELTTIFKGAAREFAESRIAGKPFEPTLNSIVFDRQAQMAFELKTVWSDQLQGFQPTFTRPLNYSEAKNVLSAWDRDWSSISSIASDYSMLKDMSNPKAFEFLKLGVYKSPGS